MSAKSRKAEKKVAFMFQGIHYERMFLKWTVLTEKLKRELTADLGRMTGSLICNTVDWTVSHLDRISCSGWSPGCSLCGTDMCRSHSCLCSDPYPHMGPFHTRSHLRREKVKSSLDCSGKQWTHWSPVTGVLQQWIQGCRQAFCQINYLIWLLTGIMKQITINKQIPLIFDVLAFSRILKIMTVLYNSFTL